MQIQIITLLILISNYSWGHGGEDHSNGIQKVKRLSPDEKLKKKYIKINEYYVQSVKPLFQKSCFDCHSNTRNYPWYYKLPGVKQLIDHDVEEAKKHLDFTKDFPFISHEGPEKDLDAIVKAVKTGSMPPFRYRIMHRDSKLTKDDVKRVKQWVKESKKILTAPN